MFARTLIRSRGCIVRGRALVSSYSLFLRQSKGTLTGMPGPKRCRALARKWWALSPAERNKYAVAAKAATPYRVEKKVARKRTSPFSQFVKANYKSVRTLPVKKRLAALAKQFKASKKL